MPDLIQLDDKRLKQLDGNIKQMVSSGASQDDVMKYAFDFKNQFGLKKKDGGEISSPIELPSVSPDFEKGKAFAEKGFLMKSEGTKEQKRMSFEPSLFGGAPEVKVLEEGEEPSILADFTSSAIKGQIQGKVANILSTGKRPTNEELGQIAQLQSDLQLFPQSKSEKAFQEKGLKALFKETPSLGVQFIAETMASSLSSLFEASKRTVPTAVAMGAVAGAPFAGIGALVGAGTGLLAGQSAAGYNISTSQDILSSLSENGVDISDKESLINAFSDETKMAKIRSTAAKYGIPILVFDVATAGLAGKLAAGAIGKSLSKKLLAGVGDTGIQIIGGSGGELAAQINSGKKVNWDEIAIEGFAEIPGGVTEVATGVAIERAKSSSNNKTLATQIATQGGENGSEDAIINLNRDLSNNVITPEQHQEGVDFVQKAAQVVDKIPETVTGESKVKSVELLVERNDIKQANQNLLQQKQTTDEAYHAGIDEEIKANEERIKKIDSEVYNIAKKPSKEFGDKKYTVDGEEVSQEAFEALTGKPIGTKTIVEPTQIGGLKVIKRVEDAGGEAVYEVEGERFLTADGKELAVSKVKIPTEVKPTEDINNVNVTIEGTTDGYKVISGDKANSIGDIRQEANEARAKGQDTFTKETVKDGKKIFTLTDTTVSDEFGRPGFKSASISFPEGTKVTMEDVMAKLKSELGIKEEVKPTEQVVEVKPTEVKEDVKVEEVKKSKLEAYKEKYAQKQKIEPIKIEDNGKPIIAKDPAENDIAIAKLAKQDNPVEEPSIKVIESQGANAENLKDKELTESIGQVDDKIKLATRIEMVAMNDLKTDEASFQNREGLNLKKVDDIVANYNPSEFDPIIYWTDANGQKYTLNHHRFAAAQKLKLDEIPAQKLTYPLGHPKEFQVVPATDKAEAIDFAINRSNANRSMETAVERAKALRKLQKTGTKEDVNKFLEREGKNKTKIQNIAALNENGKTIDALKMFGDAEDVQLQKETEQRSDWIGEARRRISGLTNEHENEMFDFLMDKDASKRITSKADFISKVTSLAGGFDFNPENPLNLKRFKYQTEGERAYDEVTGQLKSEIDTRQTKIDDLKARFSDPSRRDYIPTNSRDYEQTKKIADEQISKLNTEIKSFQQKLQDHYKEKGKYQGGIEQGGLFATEQATTEEIDDMSNIVKDFYDDGIVKLDDIKREVAKELGFNNKSLEDVVERAYNKMVMEYTPVEISKGVIGKVGEKLNELGEDGVVMLEDDESIFAKAAQLAETGGRVEFQATLPNGEKVTAKPVDASIVNGFYSPLELQINQMKADKMPAKQWLDKLKGEEAKWTGLADWLSQQEGSLTKENIKNWLQDNQIQINEIVKGAFDFNDKLSWKYRASGDGVWTYAFNGGSFIIDASEADGSARIYIVDSGGANEVGLINYSDREQILDLALERNTFENYIDDNFDLNSTKYSKYVANGEKSDYKEILITYPTTPSVSFEKWNENKKSYGESEGTLEEYKKAGQLFKSSHFDEKNILVHVRADIRTDAKGNKIYFIEEVQSDWGQEGKKKGFFEDVTLKEIERHGNLKNVIGVLDDEYNKINMAAGYADRIDLLSASEFLLLPVNERRNKIEKTHEDFQNRKDEYINFLQGEINRKNEIIRNNVDRQNILEKEEYQLEKFLDTVKSTREFNQANERLTELNKEIKKLNREAVALEEENIGDSKMITKMNNEKRNDDIGYNKSLESVESTFDINEYNKIEKEFLELDNKILLVRTHKAPFVTKTNDWAKLGLKIALKQAVKQGADKIAWTNGEQQNERYDLSKQVSYIEKVKQSDINKENDQFVVDISFPSGMINLFVKKDTGIIDNYLGNRIGDLRGKDLSDVIGKDMADKIMTGEDKRYEGEGLRIGGKGMIGFYGSPKDNSLGILGDLAKSLYKQVPEKISLNIKEAKLKELQKELDEHTANKTSDFKMRDFHLEQAALAKTMNDSEKEEGNKKEAEYYEQRAIVSAKYEESVLRDIKKLGVEYQYSVNITPELKAQVEVGLPLFMAKPSGDILGFTYGKTIYLNASKINPNTPIHEGGHIWTRWVKKNNPKVYDRGMELVKNSKYLERAKSSKFYQEQAAKLPQAEREDYFQEEALAMAIGDKGAQFVAEAKKSSFKEWLDNLWNAIKNAAGFDNITAKELQNLTFDEFAKRAARDILSPKSEQLKPTQNAIQEQSAKEKVPRAISAGEDITEGGERVRPSKQRTKITAESKGDEEAVRMRSLYKQVITRSKGLTEEQKSILKNDPNALYTVLPIAESKRIALELIQEMGVAEAVAEASSSTTTLQPVERTMILGAAMDYYAKLGKEKLKNGDMPSAQTAARKEIDANEELRKVASTLGQLGTDYGRAINAFKEIYKLSSLALERKLVKDVEELNEEREEGATEDAKQIKKIITEDASDIEDVADELTNEEVESKLDAAKKVSDLEKQVENLRREILERDKAQKGPKKNPLRIKRITNDTEYDKRLKDFKQRARSIASKDDLVDLTYFGLYHIENGITKFADWYKEMSKNFKGFRSQFKNIYNSVAEKAAENGADRNMFDNDEKIQSVLDDFQQETDAKKIVQATKKVAQAKLKREEENNPERAVKIAPSLAAERIRKDAEKNLDMPSTEVEQTYLKRLVKVINNKAKEYYAEKKENISNVNDVLAFAIANGKKDFAIWERTQTELEEQIDEDEKLTEDEKEEVKDFLQAYRESIFETLLTKNQISEAVREKLIENGYFVERIVKGKPVKSVDWSKITGNASTLKEAKEKIVKSITDLGFTEAQAKGEINAILDYFDAKISEKKTAEINKYLQKGILNKVKALGKKKVKRNSVDKLVELNKKGLLDDAKIKEILAAELGLMEITNDDLKNLREWSSKVDDENTPIFIRKEFEEKIQYLFDTKSGNINYLENRAASMSNRLSSVVNQVINLTGFLRAPSTLITVAITTGKPIAAARVFLKELVNATQEAKTIMKGRVSRGSSFDDLIGTTSGQPRTRYLEQGKGKFLGGRALGKSIYVQIGGNKVDLNPVNFGYSKIKYISRLLESADTMASGPISGITQFRIATKDINRYYPELSAAQRSQKVYDILYTVDMAVETPKAIKDLKNAGVTNPTEAEINRTINERVERARGQRLAEELYQAAKSLNLISETKLKSDGIANPTEDEILAQSYKTLGSTQAADLVARGERQAARETGKMTTRGITSFILLPVDMVQKSLNSGLKSNSKAVTTLSEIGDVSFSVLMPFANSIARWAEMTAELFAPYGIAKGASYKIGAKFTSKKSKISAEEYSDLGDDYLIRGTQGLAMTLLIMYAVGMLNKAEDDEQEELGKSFTGTAKEKQYALEKVQSVGKPKQSVNILGTNVSLAFLGNQGLAIGMYADFLKLRSKRKLDENMTERGELFISGLAAMEAFGGYMFDATYLSTAKKYGSAASSLIEMKEEGYMPTLGRLAGGIISSQIPFNRLQVEAATLFNPKSQSSKDFGSNLLAQMSITRAFQSGKPNFDYRGREYDYGDIYANSADGIRKMFGKAKYGDEIDAFLSEINFAATDAYRETRDEDNYKFSILNLDETKRFMTNEEYYEFKKKTANKFNEYIKEDYKDIKDEVVDEGSLADVQKQIVSQLLSDAKSNAFIEIQESTGFDDAQYLRQLAKEKEKAQKVISKIKKYYKK